VACHTDLFMCVLPAWVWHSSERALEAHVAKVNGPWLATCVCTQEHAPVIASRVWPCREKGQERMGKGGPLTLGSCLLVEFLF
jgi:hypothetical protein